MTPQEEEARQDHWLDPVSKKPWIAEKELEPWDYFISQIIKRALEDITDPKPFGETNWSRWTERRRAEYLKNVSLEAEEFFLTDRLEKWMNQFNITNTLTPESIRRRVIKHMNMNKDKINEVRGYK